MYYAVKRGVVLHIVRTIINAEAYIVKKQIRRLSPHQNGKVFGILMAIATLPMLIPFWGMAFFVPDEGMNSTPTFLLFIFPIIYLIFGYLSVAFGCFVYNTLFRFIGGFEFIVVESETSAS